MTPAQSAYSMTHWRGALRAKWQTYFDQTVSQSGLSRLEMLTAIVLAPLVEKDGINPQRLVRSLKAVPGTEDLVKLIQYSAARRKKPYQPQRLAKKLVERALSDEAIQQGLEILFLRTAAILNLKPTSPLTQTFTAELLQELWTQVPNPSALRLMTERIHANGNIAIAGANATIIVTNDKSEKPDLRLYLRNLRTDLNHPELSRVLPAYARHTEYTLRLHQIYTPMDVWRKSNYDNLSPSQVMQRRFRAIEKDLADFRRPVLEAIAAHPLLVLTGDAGTGKSSLARYVGTALAYLSDPDSEKSERISGQKMLGISWIHGPLLPLFITLKDFTSSKHFPSDEKKATANSLLKFIREQVGEFNKFLNEHLTAPAKPNQPYHTMLILDGLDEVYNTQHRVILQKIIECWATTYPTSRILVTSRTYAYRQGDRWYLSDRFSSAELAPYTRQQMRTYIENWYHTAALTRPASFGGSTKANQITAAYAADMITHIQENNSLFTMMRQPLLLAMLTLIHETRQQLPEKHAELYNAAIDLLLYQWRSITTDKHYAEKLKDLERNALLNALKLTAFSLQAKHPVSQHFPDVIDRANLKQKLIEQNQRGIGIGCDPDDLLSYLATHNGLLLPVLIDSYRFPHLSIQEYMAACALIELYDECEMPLPLPPNTIWHFPVNLVALLQDDPFRWRQVALMVGSIMANNIGQDMRWHLIEALIPTKNPIPDRKGEVFRIYIAGEIWRMNNQLIVRLTTHQTNYDLLESRLKQIKDSRHLDEPEKQTLREILREMAQRKH